MTIYKVRTGYKEDHYGYATNEENAKYFFNREDAEALYKQGAYIVEETQITMVFKDGTTSVGKTGGQFYEERKANAKPNEIVELVKVKYNRYKFEEIEVL